MISSRSARAERPSIKRIIVRMYFSEIVEIGEIVEVMARPQSGGFPPVVYDTLRCRIVNHIPPLHASGRDGPAGSGLYEDVGFVPTGNVICGRDLDPVFPSFLRADQVGDELLVAACDTDDLDLLIRVGGDDDGDSARLPT